jgi:predicted O-linked N-acetylglucosamine transferase (SPINDLY family)
VKNFIELPSAAKPERVGLHAVDEDDSAAESDAAYARAIAERIRADGIDILVDLASHTMPLGAFRALALKPAPVQVTWMGVMATTGLPAMDYFLGNAEIPPPGTEHTFTEKIYRLPGAAGCYRPTNDKLEVARSPYFSNQYLTFGCFNSPKKITREVVQVWSLILHLHPGSKLLLKYKELDQEYAQLHLRKWFTEDGISPDRLLFEGISLPSKYLPTWNKVDIALDPFPYNGGTTTYDAIWMGVPVVSMGGRLTVSCGSCIVSELGMPVAKTIEQYVAIACGLAKAVPSEPGLRQRVRQAMKGSRMMDEPRLARELEAAYREMWQTWCTGQTGSAKDC